MIFRLLITLVAGVEVTPLPAGSANDPLFTLLATVVFGVVSLGGGLLAFKWYNRKRPE